jgi:hypothetical protein
VDATPRDTLVVTTPSTEAWGYLPMLSVIGALGLMVLALANTFARFELGGAQPLFWIGLLIIFAPAMLRLLASDVTRRESIGLICLLGIELYLVKVMHSPIGFTFLDEFVHWRTAIDIMRSEHLFRDNPMVPASALYPGFEVVTAALAGMGGISIFDAGLIVLGVARLVMMLALFLFFEEISGSSRVAGIATALYAGTPNYVFWLAQFSYESLALPLAAMVLYAAVYREQPGSGMRISLTVVVLLGLVAVTTTHHLTSLAIVLFLVTWGALLFYRSRGLDLVGAGLDALRWYAGELPSTRLWQTLSHQFRLALTPRNRLHASGMPQQGPGGAALIALVIGLTWLVYVASLTVGYLAPVLSGAVVGLVRMIVGEDSGRQLFHSEATGQVAPLLERLTGIGAAGLTMLGLILGLLHVWRTRRSNMLLLALAIATLAFPLTLALRLSGKGWEVANRSGEFIFVGVALVLALWAVEQRLPAQLARLRALAMATCATIIFAGGVIAGWPPQWRLPGEYQTLAVTRSIEPQGIRAAEWARDYLGSDRRVATDQTNSLLMVSYGQQHIMTTLSGGIDPNFVLYAPAIVGRQKGHLLRGQVEYMVVDNRLRDQPERPQRYYPNTDINQAFDKFDQTPLVSRVLDSGDIVIYDVGAVRDEP